MGIRWEQFFEWCMAKAQEIRAKYPPVKKPSHSEPDFRKRAA